MPPIIPSLALKHLERAASHAAELRAELAEAKAICEVAASEGAPRDACVFLDMVEESARGVESSIDRLSTIARDSIMDRRKEARL